MKTVHAYAGFEKGPQYRCLTVTIFTKTAIEHRNKTEKQFLRRVKAD